MKKIGFLLPLGLACVPAFVLAAPGLWPTGYWGPLISCVGGGAVPAGLTTCTSLCDILSTGQNIIYFGMSVLLFILTPIMTLWGGFQIFFSGGNSSALSSGRAKVFGALIGVAIGLGAFVIINTFLWALGKAGDPTGKTSIAWPEISCSVQSYCGANNQSGQCADSKAICTQTNGQWSCQPPGGGGGVITGSACDTVTTCGGDANQTCLGSCPDPVNQRCELVSGKRVCVAAVNPNACSAAKPNGDCPSPNAVCTAVGGGQYQCVTPPTPTQCNGFSGECYYQAIRTGGPNCGFANPSGPNPCSAPPPTPVECYQKIICP